MEMRTQKTDTSHTAPVCMEMTVMVVMSSHCLVTVTVSRLDFRFIRVQCELYIENALIGK